METPQSLNIDHKTHCIFTIPHHDTICSNLTSQCHNITWQCMLLYQCSMWYNSSLWHHHSDLLWYPVFLVPLQYYSLILQCLFDSVPFLLLSVKCGIMMLIMLHSCTTMSYLYIRALYCDLTEYHFSITMMTFYIIVLNFLHHNHILYYHTMHYGERRLRKIPH